MIVRSSFLLLVYVMCCIRLSYSETVSSEVHTEENPKNSNIEADSSNFGIEERSARSPRKHLRKHDANRVAQYFLNGGPLLGHSHFRRAQDTDDDDENSDNRNVAFGANNLYHTYAQPTDGITPGFGTGNPNVGIPHIPSIFPRPRMFPIPHHPSPYVHPYNTYHPYHNYHPYNLYHPYYPYRTHPLNSVLNPALHKWHTPLTGLLGSSAPTSPGIVGSSNSAQETGNENCSNDQKEPVVGSPQTESSTDEIPDTSPGIRKNDPVFEAMMPNTPIQAYDPIQKIYNSILPFNLFGSQPTGYILRLRPLNPQISPFKGTLDTLPQVSDTDSDDPAVGASNTETEADTASHDDDNENYQDAEDTSVKSNDNENEDDEAEDECEETDEEDNGTVAKREESRKIRKTGNTPVFKKAIGKSKS